ncbi:thiazole biosynthesis protein ThiH [Alkaliphilus metalliredigens QYMF]|uniref:Thiazole biosynthesis protein ThiH n=1 Tax=Alkaliphilus metalliredigens (strain QYMF) TaxID=293826 RepID=A6TVU6_ALKMQ|nr:2-iminoacetate synthase ThiH [Alkaliphilus metalliredigens]ABR50314.1 thiazole biosynthesis protein ThiH [Alkaliphilus metalliredigens QYMF]
MSFYDTYLEYENFDTEGFLKEVKEPDVLGIIKKNKLNHHDFLALLSPAAANCLEEMAQRAQELSLQHFGKTVLLYTPLYLSNYCVNRCAYCSYNIDHDIKRKKLTYDEIEKEAQIIAETGLKHILLLTGESRIETPVSYLVEAVKIMKKYFDSIAIEIDPLEKEDYQRLIEAGVDGLTIYQEVYDEEVYKQVHLAGPKRNYHFRLDAPERACEANIHNVNIGALLGLNKWQHEAFMTGMHANYLQNKYNDVELSISLPRIRPHVGGFRDVYPVTDQDLVQVLLAFRIYLPYVAITMSTRERGSLRDHLIPLGVTKMSAGVTTEVGGHSDSDKGDSQFEISDTRSVEEMRKAILNKGYQPIFKNWMAI